VRNRDKVGQDGWMGRSHLRQWNILVEPQLDDAARKAAAEAGMNLSAWVRHLIRAELRWDTPGRKSAQDFVQLAEALRGYIESSREETTEARTKRRRAGARRKRR
jgi:hypothetical protein